MTDDDTDFGASDSWADNGLNCCANCEMQLGGQGGHFGEIVTEAGVRYDDIYESDPDEAPFFCPDCWREVRTQVRAERNQSINDFR